MPAITTEHLRLRMLRPADLDDYHATIYGDKDVMVYMPGGKPRPRQQVQAVIDEFLNHWEQHGFGLWAVEWREDGSFVGHCGLMRLAGSEEVELAYALAKPYWGKGLATEAARATLRFGFEVVQLPEILALAVPDNIGSRRVMEKLGMQFDGLQSRYHDAELALYRIKRHEFQDNGATYALQD
jgi:ribosomal-protein-alanine N-acetyltransferase